MRILLYSPDSYGLGHVRRSLSIAGELLARGVGASVRLVTGAPRAHYFDYPAGCDYVRLPLVTKDGDGSYIGADADLTLRETVNLRARMIEGAARAFGAETLLVDHSPRGLCGEVLSTLCWMGQRQGAARVLGMRDVIDDPAVVRRTWQAEGVYDVLRRCYDRILVYGQQELFDPTQAYAFPADVASKTRFVGYIPRRGSGDSTAQRERWAPRTGRLVLVTLGGGGDGVLVLRAALDAYAKLGTRPPFDLLAVTGPLMSPRKREGFKAHIAGLPGASLIEYTRELPELMQAADLVVAMGGYNTVCELACAGARALIVPRTAPRREQWIRARLLEQLGVASCLEPERVDADTLAAAMLAGLERARPKPGWGLCFTGLSATIAEISHFRRSGACPVERTGIAASAGSAA